MMVAIMAVTAPRTPGQLEAHHDRPVDGDGSGGGLSNGNEIQHLILLNPVQLIHKFLLHQRDDNIAAAEGKRA